MKCIKILVIALLGISILGCSMRENQGDIDENSIIWEADLTHDGEKERKYKMHMITETLQ